MEEFENVRTDSDGASRLKKSGKPIQKIQNIGKLSAQEIKLKALEMRIKADGHLSGAKRKGTK